MSKMNNSKIGKRSKQALPKIKDNTSSSERYLNYALQKSKSTISKKCAGNKSPNSGKFLNNSRELFVRIVKNFTSLNMNIKLSSLGLSMLYTRSLK